MDPQTFQAELRRRQPAAQITVLEGKSKSGAFMADVVLGEIWCLVEFDPKDGYGVDKIGDIPLFGGFTNVYKNAEDALKRIDELLSGSN